MNFKSSLLTGLTLFFSLSLFSKNIYLKFDPACMDRLEYRLNGNMAGNGLISYSLRASSTERVVMEIGVESIKQVKRMPRGTKTCGKVRVNELLANSINSGKDKVYIVRKVGKNYIVSPVHLATYMKDSKQKFSMKGNELDMSYVTSDIGVMENNLSDRNSTTKVYFIGTEKQVCSDAYMLKKIPIETCKPYTDMTFVPGLGIIEEKIGLNQAEAENNVLRLVKVNNIPLAEYMDRLCGKNDAELAVKYQAPAEPSFKPATTTKPTAPSPEPAGADIIFPANITPPAPEYTPAGSELVYEYDQPQKPLETFRPKGVDCKNLSYPGVHIIQPSQTLYSISRKYNVTVNQLRTWNKMANADLIKPCESLYVLPPETIIPDNASANVNTQPELMPKGAEVHFRNTAPAQNATPTPYDNTAGDDAVFSNVAKQSDILYPKSGTAPANDTKAVAAKPKDACNKLTYEGVHIVQKGETLYSLSKEYDLTVKQIRKWNKLGKKDPIKPCMSLYIKTPEAVIAAINKPDNPAPDGENYTIPGSDISTGYTNAPENPRTQPKGNPTATETPTAIANPTSSDKMWNSGIEYHVVEKGETLSSLARKYGFTLERFRDINGLGDSNIIRIGQVLRTGNCLCPANGVGPTNTSSTATNTIPNNGSATNTATSGTIRSDNGTIVNTPPPAVEFTEKGKGNTNRTTERSTEYVPVPTPYDYETETILNNTKRVDGTISYRNGRKVHTVQENETMATIANTYNIPIELLRKLNKMEKSEIVIPDMKIYLE